PHSPLDLQSQNLATGDFVAERESARNNQELRAGERCRIVEEVRRMHALSFESSQLQGPRCFCVAVDAVPAQYSGLGLFHEHVPPSSKGRPVFHARASSPTSISAATFSLSSMMRRVGPRFTVPS